MKRVISTAVALFLLAGPGKAQATFIIYTETCTISGTLGVNSFTNAATTFTFTDDTNNVMFTGGLFARALNAAGSVNIDGVGVANFTDNLQVFDNHESSQLYLLDTSNPLTNQVISVFISTPFATYNLNSSIGPITAPVLFGGASTGSFATNAGSLSITSFTNQYTFTAVLGTSAVPEPSSLAMCGLAGVIGSAYTWRRRKARQAA